MNTRIFRHLHMLLLFSLIVCVFVDNLQVLHSVPLVAISLPILLKCLLQGIVYHVAAVHLLLVHTCM